MSEKNITFEIREHLGVIAESENGWCKELNIISWNGNAPKYDIRDWDPHHERMRKGVTLRESELRRLVDLYLHHNSQKAVELGRSLEAERQRRRSESAEQYRKSKEAGDDAEDHLVLFGAECDGNPHDLCSGESCDLCSCGEETAPFEEISPAPSDGQTLAGAEQSEAHTM